MPHKNEAERKQYHKDYRNNPKNRSRIKANLARFKKLNPDYSNGYYGRYVISNPDYYKMRNLKRYGLSLEQYNDLLWKQGCKCALCGSPDHNGKGWHVDHCHKTYKVRGLLCNNCNVGLGHFKEDVMLLKIAIDYLVEHSGLEGKL